MPEEILGDGTFNLPDTTPGGTVGMSNATLARLNSGYVAIKAAVAEVQKAEHDLTVIVDGLASWANVVLAITESVAPLLGALATKISAGKPPTAPKPRPADIFAGLLSSSPLAAQLPPGAIGALSSLLSL